MIPRESKFCDGRQGVFAALPLCAVWLWILACLPAGWAMASEVATGIHLVKVIPSGRAPHQIAFSPDGTTAYIAAAGSDRIDEIDTATLSWRSAYPAPGAPLGIAVDSDGAMLISRFRGESLIQADAHGVMQAELAIGAAPSLLIPIVAADEGQRWLVSSEKANQASVIASKPWRSLLTFDTGQRPFPGAATSDGRRAFIPNYDDGTVTIFDLVEQRALGTVAVGSRPSGGVVLPGNAQYAVSVRGDHRIALIDTRTLMVTGEIRAGIGKEPFSIVVDSIRNLAFVNNTASNDVSVINLVDQKVIQRLKVGEIPIVMALEPNAQRLWVACEGTHDIHVLQLPPLSEIPTMNLPNVTPQPTTAPIMPTSEHVRVIGEVRQLHHFFQEWFSGRLAADEAQFARFSGAMAPDLSFIAPSGKTLMAKALVDTLRQAHGQDREHGLRIWTENEQVRDLGPGVWLVRYEEHQIRDGERRVRQSSAVLRDDADAPNGLRWLHVHETWLGE